MRSRPLSVSVHRPGVSMAWMVLLLGTLVIIVALALDGGRMMDERRLLQASADAAALAAARDLFENYTQNQGQDPDGSAAAEALRIAAANGFGASETEVAVHIPPQTGTFAGKDDFVEVILTAPLRGTFSAMITAGELPVRARAVARGRPVRLGVLILNSSQPEAFSVSGNGHIRVRDADAAINSSSSMALSLSANAVLEARSHRIVGGLKKSGNASIIGTVHTDTKQTVDPLGSLQFPSVCAYPDRSCTKRTVSGNSSATLQPGVYRDGISVSGNANVTLLPGVYILDGGGFQVSGNGKVQGNGVVLCNTGGHDAGPITLSGNAQLTLSAPTEGPFRGIGIFQDRAVSKKLQISGNGSVQLKGLVYAPAAQIDLSGNGTSFANVMGGGYVCNVLHVSGNGDFTIDAGTNRPRIPDVGLAE